MAKDNGYNEIIENLADLSDEEIQTAKDNLAEDFAKLESDYAENKSRETVEEMMNIGNAFEAIQSELSSRAQEEAELAQAAEEAALKVKGAQDEDEDEDEADAEAEFTVETEDKTDDSADEDDESEDEAEFANEDPEVEKAEAEADRAEAEADRAEAEADRAEDAEEVAVSEEEKVVDEDEDAEFASDDPEEDQEDSEGGDSEETENEDDESDTTESDSDMAKINDFSAPADNAPKAEAEAVERKTATITAAADIKGYTSGAEMPNFKAVAQAILDRRKAMGRTSGGDGEQALVATFSHTDFYSKDFTLDSADTEGNREKIDAVVAALQGRTDDELEAVVAAGGLYGPVETSYDIFEMGETSVRPVKNALPSFNADRGGLRFMTPPVMADLDGAVSVWTLEDDVAAAEDGGPVKPCIRVKAGEEVTVYLEAMPLCLTFGNLGARAWPELVERHIALGMALQARFAEVRLLTRIGSLSTQVTTEAELGAARDILVHLEAATTAMRNRHRLDPKAPLKAMFPEWFRNALRADLVKQIPGDGQDTAFNLVDATIDKWFAARNVSVTWFLDGEEGQTFGAQEDGALLSYPENVVWYLFPEGTFLHLDGGTLDLGLVRDSTLNATNDYKIFLETFENVAKVGVESLRITTPVKIAGASASTVETIGV